MSKSIRSRHAHTPLITRTQDEAISQGKKELEEYFRQRTKRMTALKKFPELKATHEEIIRVGSTPAASTLQMHGSILPSNVTGAGVGFGGMIIDDPMSIDV